MTTPVNIREATPATAGHVVRIVNAAYHRVPGASDFQETRADVLARMQAGTVLLFSRDGKDCGTVSYAPDTDRPGLAVVTRFAVHPAVQHRTVGTAMGALLIARLRAQGYTFAHGFTDQDMHAAQALYARAGAVLTPNPDHHGLYVHIDLRRDHHAQDRT